MNYEIVFQAKAKEELFDIESWFQRKVQLLTKDL